MTSFRIVNFPFICGNITSAPAYGVFILQHIRYTRACRNYLQYRTRLLTIKHLEQGYAATRLKSSPQKFYGRHRELVDCYFVSICTTNTECHSFPFLFRLPWTCLFPTQSVQVAFYPLTLKTPFHGNASHLIAILFPDWRSKKMYRKLKLRAMCYFLNEIASAIFFLRQYLFKTVEAYRTDAPCSCFQFLAESELIILLLLCMHYFDYFILFLCVPVSHVLSSSLDYLEPRILVPLITLEHIMPTIKE